MELGYCTIADQYGENKLWRTAVNHSPRPPSPFQRDKSFTAYKRLWQAIIIQAIKDSTYFNKPEEAYEAGQYLLSCRHEWELVFPDFDYKRFKEIMFEWWEDIANDQKRGAHYRRQVAKVFSGVCLRL